MEYIAHFRESDKKNQTVEEHLREVRKLAEGYGEKIGVRHVAGLAGMLHDLGKFSDEFREYINEAKNNPEKPPKRGSVDHATAGGRLLYHLYHQLEKVNLHKYLLAEIVGNAIISHHSYLKDFLTPSSESEYLKRVRDKEAPELARFDLIEQRFFDNVMDRNTFQKYVEKAEGELVAFFNKDKIESGSIDIKDKELEKKAMFLTKFIFSAVVDADRNNTREFEQNQKDSEVDVSELYQVYYHRLMEKVHSFTRNNHINELRAEMSDQCEEFAEHPSGIYTLSIPTGGGKTFASLRYALKHALLKGKKRIIYVVPYTTIIEQNAEEVRNVLEGEGRKDTYILEHHSNVIDDVDEGEKIGKWELARDNWDYPIIFTTMVQFLNVFYAKGNRNTRRLHNLSDAIIIFDEVQKVPIPCVSLFNYAVNFLKEYCHSSVILCTATQPALNHVEHSLKKNDNGEIVQELDHVIEAFKRVEIVDKTEIPLDTNCLAEFVEEKIQEVESILVILNTKRVVKELYDELTDRRLSIPVYHLSTSMCPAHRKDILAKVKEHLKAKEPVICISTQLIEAGVDVSFDCVIRSLAGLDSIAQAAGRCNRHGEHELRYVYMIHHSGESLKNLIEIETGKNVVKEMLAHLRRDENLYGGDLLSKEAMEVYFQNFYKELEKYLDYNVSKKNNEFLGTMVELLTCSRGNNRYLNGYHGKYGTGFPVYLTNSYKTAADYFEVIKNLTTTVIVPYGEEGEEIINILNGDGFIEDVSGFLRKAQQFTVNIHEPEKNRLSENGAFHCHKHKQIYWVGERAYDTDYGLNVHNDSLMDDFVI